MLNYLGIEAFLTIVKTKTLTNAAEELHLSQSTISYRLKVLEQEVGKKLLIRKKGVQEIILTPFGEEFINICERWMSLQQEMEILKKRGTKLSIIIGGADSFNSYILSPLYQKLCQHNPIINIEIRSQHTDESYESVERRDIDIAFVKKERIIPNVLVEPFYEDEMVVVRLATDYRVHNELISPEELNSNHEIFMNWGPSYQIWHEKWWDPISSSRIIVDTAALVFSLMYDENQWAIVPRSIANHFIIYKKFIIQKLKYPAPPRICYKIRNKHMNKMKQECLEILEHYAKIVYSTDGEGLSFPVDSSY
ncbi:LysR family transcriptional regulator [Alkaliphilus sp. MSJ-5]|uniref:LysR family transcriptional regulator n=1 Tax=Alkaliphilus flagellatus TaxID=2841507 RepID=A0ABS6FXE5_9FIRM|nr:LysR family transcriptional regulator [Alkaliphilus flagellatus]MBU5674915.1 LysR family transcriptional regulator [Alkaliphilus flagellatus]